MKLPLATRQARGPMTPADRPRTPESRLGWHFLPADRRLANGDKRLVRAGMTLRHKGGIVPCKSGLHASASILDALNYGSGPIICRVRCGPPWIEHGDPVDKFVAQTRTVLWSVHGEKLLREFACWCALQVIGLWEAPPVVREYLKTGNESIRVAAGDAARAAEGAAWAAKTAARAAAGAAEAVEATAWAARAAAWAAEGAVGAAAKGAVGAAEDAARRTQERKLLRLVMAKHRRNNR